MRAEKVVKALLEAATGVTALTGTRLYAITRPESDALPAVVWSIVSDRTYSTVNQLAGPELMEARIELACMSETAGELKSLIEQVRLAVHLKSGTINGVQVVASVQDFAGPEQYDTALAIYMQSIDFMIDYYR